MTNLIKKTVSLLFCVFLSLSIYAQTNYDDFFSDEFAMAGFDGSVSSIYQTNDGQIFVGGNFKWFNGNKSGSSSLAKVAFYYLYNFYRSIL